MEKIAQFPQYYSTTKTVLPLLLVRGTIVFPGEISHFELESDTAEEVLEWALKNRSDVVVLSLLDPTLEEPTFEDFSPIGTVVSIRQSFRLPGQASRVIVEGQRRAEVLQLIRTDPYVEGEVLVFDYHADDVPRDEKLTQLMRLTSTAAVNFLKGAVGVPEMLLFPITGIQDPGQLADTLAAHLDLRPDEQLELLAELDVVERLYKLRSDIKLLTELSSLDREINERAQERMQQSQKEMLLREQMSILREELGEGGGDPDSLGDEYREAFADVALSSEAREAVEKEIERLSYLSPMSPEVNISRSYLDTILDLPWGEYTEDSKDLEESRSVLERDHYGLKDVKERILDFLSVRMLREDSKGSILCFVGPPGVGKTSIARAIAQAMGREFISMRLGGVTDEAEIRGHRRTYVGAMPGRIIYHLTKAHSMNPVFLLDEVDKMGSDFRGDPASALLEVLDPEQNHAFQDRFLEIPFDLSQVMFVTTANTLETIPAPLRDRMEVIEIAGYTDTEKLAIARRHLVPKVRAEAGLKASQVRLSTEVLDKIIHGYTREAGVRELERQIEKIMRRAAREIVSGKLAVSVGKRNLKQFLGVEKYVDEPVGKQPAIGVVNGLAWTEVGGEILKVEANLMEGRGQVHTTGSIGAVMRESAELSFSYVRANASRYGIDPAFYATLDAHIHMPEGAVPKDGPSAGVTILTALVSALTKRPVRNDIAMTGEVTLTGQVLAIGGVKEKILAAKRYGIMTVFLPKENMRELIEMDEDVKRGMNFVPVDHVDEVLQAALLEPKEMKAPIVFRSSEPSSAFGFHVADTAEAQADAVDFNASQRNAHAAGVWGAKTNARVRNGGSSPWNEEDRV
ncbi:MAG: endopeptidase La [Peptoniphilaceae bacterium]|nr:endopeptidase La [Peptoniphilaceae bacterium]MDY6085714.1 endopeptidase La [Peptoniphilaceae bacterium]